MSGVLLDALTNILSILLMGAAIKLMDDHLDAEYDICRGKRTLAVKLGRAVLPYTLLFATIAVFLRPNIGMSLFLGSYTVGMFSAWREKLPSRLPAYLEITASVLVSLLLVGWQWALWGIALMAVFDWVDDLVDLTGDRMTGERNIALKFGLMEATLLTLTALAGAIWLNPVETAFGFLGFAILTALSELTTSSLWTTVDDDSGGIQS